MGNRRSRKPRHDSQTLTSTFSVSFAKRLRQRPAQTVLFLLLSFPAFVPSLSW